MEERQRCEDCSHYRDGCILPLGTLQRFEDGWCTTFDGQYPDGSWRHEKK